MKTLLLEQMTSPQIREAIAHGYRTVVVAGGSTEQHGLHLPIGADAMLGYQAAEAIARELGQTLVAPIIRPGCSDHHLQFSGSISLPIAVYQQVVRAYCSSLCQHGFERIVLMTAHGGNTGAMRQVAPQIAAELPSRVVFVDIIEDPRVEAVANAALAQLGVTPQAGGLHAGFQETALFLASPDAGWADMAAARPGFVGDAWARIRQLQAAGAWSVADVSPIGVIGDPTGADAAAGNRLLAALAPAWAAIVREALAAAEQHQV